MAPYRFKEDNIKVKVVVVVVVVVVENLFTLSLSFLFRIAETGRILQNIFIFILFRQNTPLLAAGSFIVLTP